MLRGKYALVTGGSRGIGFEIADMLVKEGCKVVITGRNSETLHNAASKIHEEARFIEWDVSDLTAAHEMISQAAELIGGLDIVVNNAGIFAQTDEWGKESLLKTTPYEWEKVMKTNTSALFFIMQAAVGYMRKNNIRGNILNITSVAGYEPVYGAYGASKIASSSLTRGWGRMFADDGIVINGIAPGPVATEMNGWHEGDPMNNDRIPSGRFITTKEIGNLAKYLLDENSTMVCGETVVIDGGYAIR